MRLTAKQHEALSQIANVEDGGLDGMCSGRIFTKRMLDGLVRRGMLIRGGTGVVCDGDGFTIEPERERQLWKITPDGRKAIEGY